MDSLFRCANCAKTLKKPDVKCPECGYQRGMPSPDATRWYVYLVDFGSDSQKTAMVLSRKLGKSESEIRTIRQNLPAWVLTAGKKHKADHIAKLFLDAGADVRISTKPYSDSSKIEAEAEEYSHKDLEDKKKFSWLLPLIAVIPVLLTLVPDLAEQLPALSRRIVRWHIEEEFSQFEEVLIIVSAKDMEAGEILELDHIRVRAVERKSAPENAVPPLHADKLIGRSLKNSVQINQVITLECVTDNERPF
jgi:hypothetical protein